MQIRTSLAVTGAVIAIVAPSAAAQIPLEAASHPSPAHALRFAGPIKRVHLVKKSRPVSAAKRRNAAAKHAASKPATTRVVPRMIVVPGGPLVPSTGVDDCVTYMVNCTDEQYCDLWGFNCAAVASQGAVSDAAEPKQSGESGQSSQPVPSSQPVQSGQ